MQKLQCELCGSVDFQRTNDGFFQCQHCGCKYTLEQAKTILGGTVETTIGDAELNRRVENARAQIKIGQPADETIESIIRDFPASPKGYFLYFENIFEKVIKEPAQCSIDGNVAVSRYNSLYAIAKDSPEISDEADMFFNGYSTKIYNGLINGELPEEAARKIAVVPYPAIKKTYEIGKNNAALLKANNIGIVNTRSANVLAYCSDTLFISRKNSYCDYEWEMAWLPIAVCLGKEWYEKYKMPVKPLILTEKNIGEVVRFAKDTTRKIVVDKRICMWCGSKTKKALIGSSYKCSNDNCGAVYPLSDLM